MRSRFRTRLDAVLLAIGSVLCTPGVLLGATQVITLQPGWNLITFQVLPDQRSPEIVFSALKSEINGKPLFDSEAPSRSNVVAAYDLVAATPQGEMTTFSWRGFQPIGVDKVSDIPRTDSNQLNAQAAKQLTSIDFGRAYFVYATAILGDSQYRIDGDAVPGSTRVEFRPTWNLVGIPLQPTDSSEDIGRTSIGSVFRAGDLSNIGRILRWDGSSQQFRTYKVGDADNWKGLIIPGVRVEVDQTSLFDPDSDGVPLGAVVRTDTRLVIRAANTERAFGHLTLVTLQSGLAPTSEGSAGFSRWRGVIGEGQDKRVLLDVDLPKLAVD